MSKIGSVVLDVTPTPTMNDEMHTHGRYAQFPPKCGLRYAAGGISATNFAHHFIGGARQCFLFAHQSLSTPLGRGVAHIVASSAQEQMLGIDTRRGVAVMADVPVANDRTVGNLIRNAMCRRNAVGSVITRSDLQDAVPEFSASANPKPTGLRLSNVLPETFTCRLRLRPDSSRGGSILRMHRMFTPFGAVPPAVCSGAGAFDGLIIPRLVGGSLV